MPGWRVGVFTAEHAEGVREMGSFTDWMEHQLATPTGSLFIPLAFVLVRLLAARLMPVAKKKKHHHHPKRPAA
jgi:hypothetical protein